MKIITKYAFLLSVVMLAACTSDDDATNNENAVVTAPVVEEMAFSGSIETDNVTRTAFSDYTVGENKYLKTVWKLADAIRVYNMAESTNNNGTFVIKDGGIDATDGKQAVFTGEKIASNGAETDKFYAVYPDMGGSSFSKDGNAVKLNATLPAVQTAITNNINPDLQFMTGYTTKRNFDFKNVVSFIKVTITNSTSTGNFKIHAIRFTSNSSEDKIAGSFTATVTDGGDPTISNVGNGAASSVVVEKEDQTPLADGVYYIAVLPTILNNGFTLQLEDLTSGKERIYKRKSTASYEIARSKVIDLGSYDAERGLENGTIYDGGIIDLGLPSGTLWATRNIAAGKDNLFVDNVYDYGQYYGWGEDFGHGETSTEGTNLADNYCNRNLTWSGYVWGSGKTKNLYEWATYKYSQFDFNLGTIQSAERMGKYNTASENTLLPEDDIAYIKSKGVYTMPTSDQASELFGNSSGSNARIDFSGSNSAQGFRLVSTIAGYTTRSLWLPAAGIYYGALFKGNAANSHYTYGGQQGFYWTKTLDYTARLFGTIPLLNLGNTTAGVAIAMDLPNTTLTDDRRYAGRSIRPVLNQK